jgi:hypothetical protein
MTSSQLFDKFPDIFVPNAKFVNETKKRTKITEISKVDNESILKSKKKPRKSPYLTSELLLSEDGLQKVYEEFPTRLKFRGRGYETDDLKKMMSAYREWAWMLNPGSAFTDFLLKCESLGNTKEIKSLLEQLRDKEKARFIHHQIAFPLLPKKTVTFKS